MVVLNNLDQPPQPTGSSPFVGQSFIAGAPQELYGAQMQLDPTAPPSSNITLEVEARNADGTVGQTLFSDFSSSYNPRSGLVTFLADAPFDFAANTGYWLVLSDPTKGSVTWEFTASQVYQSDLGYGLPSFNTAYYSDQDNGMGNALYYQPSDGPQMFDLITVPAVAEPSSIGPDGPRRGDRRPGDAFAGLSGLRAAAAAGCTWHQGGAPMSRLISPSTSLAGWSRFDRAAIARGVLPRPLTLPWSTAWAWLATGPGLWVKRAVDVVGALVGLVVFAPVLLAIALLIRLDSPGPVLFRQMRRGHRGRPFRMLKFRTMVADAERRLGDLESCNESAGGVLFKLRHDPRVTRLGRFLRRSSLDELPQLINVLKGEMSLVGPRPLQLRDSDRLRDVDPRGYRRRLQVLPGLTGPWQVGGRSELDYEQMVELDLDYVANRSLGRDLVIIGQTIPAVLLRRGAC